MIALRLVVLTLLISFFSLAQIDNGTIYGVMRDSSGGVIAGVKVVFRNTDNGLEQEAITNSDGIYVSPPLRAGNYTVAVNSAGFESVAKRVQIDVSQRVAVDFALRLGAVTQSV